MGLRRCMYLKASVRWVFPPVLKSSRALLMSCWIHSACQAKEKPDQIFVENSSLVPNPHVVDQSWASSGFWTAYGHHVITLRPFKTQWSNIRSRISSFKRGKVKVCVCGGREFQHLPCVWHGPTIYEPCLSFKMLISSPSH